MVAAVGPPEPKAGEPLQLSGSVRSGLSLPRMPAAVSRIVDLLLMRAVTSADRPGFVLVVSATCYAAALWRGVTRHFRARQCSVELGCESIDAVHVPSCFR